MINFAGGFNLPIWITERQGFFAAEKIEVKIDCRDDADDALRAAG
jgi:hypothetical protein